MKQSTFESGVVVTLASLAVCMAAGAQSVRRGSDLLVATGTVTGVVRDAEGIPQMGALVEAIIPDTGLAGSAVTDSRGRYHLNLRPGSYRLKATAALLMPAVREHLQLVRGGRSIADMTLAAMLAPTGWLPASRRGSSEPGDDWMWTLRSSSSRPMLRYADVDGDPLSVSSSRQEARRGASGGSLEVKSGAGQFARGGSHQVLVLTRVDAHGSGTILRADLSGPRTPYPVAPSAEVSVGFQRKTILNGYSRMVMTYSGHPELTQGGRATGMQGATLRSAERMELGDAVRVDAGSVLREANFGGNAVAMEPFLRVQAHAAGGLVLAYGMTRSRGTESIEDLDRVQAALPLAVMRNGHLRLETGSHHALSAAAKVRGGGVVELALYRDRLRNPLISGIGTVAAADIPAEGFAADPTTGTYRVAARDYSSDGVRVSFRQPLTHSLSAGAEFTTGRALRAAKLAPASLSDVMASLSPDRIYAGTVFTDGKILRTGTTLRASYRWQPARALTPVDAFRVGDDGAFLSCTLRQSLRRIPGMPQGLEAVVDLQNLLAEGYQPYLSTDGSTLYLAQTPRALQGGISFTF